MAFALNANPYCLNATSLELNLRTLDVLFLGALSNLLAYHLYSENNGYSKNWNQ